jgi:hypothetical protein
MAGLHRATTAEAKNRKKRKKKDKCDRKAERAVADACGRQIDSCVTSGSSLCERAIDVPACLATLRQCCDFFGQCDADGYLACIQENFLPPDQV